MRESFLTAKIIFYWVRIKQWPPSWISFVAMIFPATVTMALPTQE